MRVLKRLSPTALHKWEESREEFYIRYLSDNQSISAQTEPMSVGSAFDAMVKSRLHADFIPEPDPEYTLEYLFNTQVEEDCRAFAFEAGAWCLDRYMAVGAYDDLCAEIKNSKTLPRFEFSLRDEINGIPLQGKPDLEFNLDVPFIHDWKVNGYCGKNPTSPRSRYAMCRDTWNLEGEDWSECKLAPTRGGNRPHSKYRPMNFGGTVIGSHWMEDVDKKWADQVTIYAWMIGLPIGSEDWIASIDQLACKPYWDNRPLIRIAQHRCRVSAFWQFELLNRLQRCWETLQSGHIFTELTREESDARCEVLDMQIRDDDEFWGLVDQKGFRG